MLKSAHSPRFVFVFKVAPCLRVRVCVQNGRSRSLGQCYPIISAVANWDSKVTVHVLISRGPQI